MNRKHKYFPLFVSLEEKEVLVVGGGTIASRRIRALLPFGGPSSDGDRPWRFLIL